MKKLKKKKKLQNKIKVNTGKLIKERPNMVKRLKSAEDLIKTGDTLVERNNGEYQGRGKIISTLDELEQFEKTVKPGSETWYCINLKPRKKHPKGLVCIDIDNDSGLFTEAHIDRLVPDIFVLFFY